MRMIPQSLPPLSDLLFYTEYVGMIGAMSVAVHYLIAAVQKLQKIYRID